MKLGMAVACACLAILIYGCGSTQQKPVGFLSDYSKLQRETDTSLKYVNQKEVATYTSFIIEPVQVKYQSDATGEKQLTQTQAGQVASYLQAKLVEAVKGAGMKVVYQPGPGVARIRVALTSIEKSDLTNLLPQASLMQVGVGGATMEGEFLDSVTGKQVAAIMQSGKGSRVPFSNLGDEVAAKTVIDEWARNFQAKLEAMHAK